MDNDLYGHLDRYNYEFPDDHPDYDSYLHDYE
jgi:hypothetical protein